jgi:hypothetical protein
MGRLPKQIGLLLLIQGRQLPVQGLQGLQFVAALPAIAIDTGTALFPIRADLFSTGVFRHVSLTF